MIGRPSAAFVALLGSPMREPIRVTMPSRASGDSPAVRFVSLEDALELAADLLGAAARARAQELKEREK